MKGEENHSKTFTERQPFHATVEAILFCSLTQHFNLLSVSSLLPVLLQCALQINAARQAFDATCRATAPTHLQSTFNASRKLQKYSQFFFSENLKQVSAVNLLQTLTQIQSRSQRHPSCTGAEEAVTRRSLMGSAAKHKARLTGYMPPAAIRRRSNKRKTFQEGEL